MAILYGAECHQRLGACFEVYKEKGNGFLEPVYQECLEIEPSIREVPFEAQARLGLTYKGRPLRHHYIPDFVCFDKIIIEAKAVSALTDEHRAQLLHYLKATGLRLGFLVDFGHYPKLAYERVIC